MRAVLAVVLLAVPSMGCWHVPIFDGIKRLVSDPHGITVAGPNVFTTGKRETVYVSMRSPKDGSPVGGRVWLHLLRNRQVHALWSGRVPADGGLVAFQVPELPEGEYSLRIRTRTKYYNRENRHPVTVRSSTGLRLTTDRPLYQPGQTVHVRLVATARHPRRVLEGREVTFEVRDPQDNSIFRKTEKTSAFGVAAVDVGEIGFEEALA